jgi:DNA replication protein DnaC
MLTEPTREKLVALRLDAFATAWQAQQQDPASHDLGFDERLALLVDAECLARDTKRLERTLREAKLRLSHACLEDVDYAARRELDKPLVRQIATGRLIRENHNVLITGATGTGKTYLACALAQQACRQGHRVLYRRVPRLFEEFTLAHADGSYIRLLARFARADLLVLDEVGLEQVESNEARRSGLMQKVLLPRYNAQRSTVITSNIPWEGWGDYLGDHLGATALVDRMIHHSHVIVINGPSYRDWEHQQDVAAARGATNARTETATTATKLAARAKSAAARRRGK